MTELEFAQRLKQYRKARGLTQQELAEALGVSNKSVSRWETGGYPDVALLGPLAKALGVTVDDLLGEAPPLRALGRADWQNLLSFVFAIGGGVLFFLLDLFTPVLPAYLIYLGCLAYGVFLQQHYTYHSRWFFAAGLGMNFFVNLHLCSGLLSRLLPSFMAAMSSFLSALAQTEADGSVILSFLVPYVTTILLPQLLIALAATAVTGLVIWKPMGKGRPVLRAAAFHWAKLPPALCPLLAAAFFLLYAGGTEYEQAPLPGWCYEHQTPLFCGVVGVLALLALVWLLAVRRRAMMGPALGVSVLTLTLPLLTRTELVYAASSGKFYPYLEGENKLRYFPLLQPTAALLAAALVLAALYLLCCFVTLTREPKQ